MTKAYDMVNEAIRKYQDKVDRKYVFSNLTEDDLRDEIATLQDALNKALTELE
jgi:hypothetical protein